MRPNKDRAATLRAFAAKINAYADYFDTRERAQAKGASAEDRAADDAARDKFNAEPGAHAMFQRIEFEAELFEALEAFKARVQLAEVTRDHKPFRPESQSAVDAALHSFVEIVSRTKF